MNGFGRFHCAQWTASYDDEIIINFHVCRIGCLVPLKAKGEKNTKNYVQFLMAAQCAAAGCWAATHFHFANTYFDSIFSGKLNCSTVCATVTVFCAWKSGRRWMRSHSLNTLSGGKWLLLNIFTQRTVKKMHSEWHIGRWREAWIIARRSATSQYNFHAPTKKICEINEIYELVIVAQAII